MVLMNRHKPSRRGATAVASCALTLLIVMGLMLVIQAQKSNSANDKSRLAKSEMTLPHPRYLPVTIGDFKYLARFRLIAEDRDGNGLRNWTFEATPTERIIAHGRSADFLNQIDFYLESDRMTALRLARDLFARTEQNRICDRVADSLFQQSLSHPDESDQVFIIQTVELEFALNALGEQPALIIRGAQ